MTDFLAHLDPMFAAIDADGDWISATQCKSDVSGLFTNLLSATKRSVVQTIVVSGRLAEVYVSRHGSIVAKDPKTKIYRDTNIDSVCRDVFSFEGGEWVQYRSYTIAEQVIVDGRLVQTRSGRDSS